jgi:hypothetical protein
VPERSSTLVARFGRTTIDVPIAIQTSIKAVLVNPFTMALWGLIVEAHGKGITQMWMTSRRPRFG